jgi:DNA invertase Pin-like site-specific DNA recombinase
MRDRLCIYLRPTLDSTAADQVTALMTWADGAGYRIVREFSDPARKRGPDRRQEAQRMLAETTRRQWDRVACMSLRALCRSVTHADEVLTGLASLGIAFTALADGIDTETDGGTTAAAFALAARLEHSVHVERATIGLRRRVEAGYKHGRPRIPASTEARIVSLVRAGTSTERITRLVGCGKSAIYRVRRELELLKP